MTLETALPEHARHLAALFCRSAERYDLEPELLAAICDRESRFGAALSRDLTGDHGHGRGLMQIDDRTWAAWLRQCDWKDPAVNIDKGAQILQEMVRYFERRSDVPEAMKEAAAIAAYNAGPGTVLKAVKAGRHPDSVTTGKDYSRWVLAKAESYRKAGTT